MIKASGMSQGYKNSNEELASKDEYYDTGDLVELRENRYYFLGRESGIINIGGATQTTDHARSAGRLHDRQGANPGSHRLSGPWRRRCHHQTLRPDDIVRTDTRHLGATA